MCDDAQLLLRLAEDDDDAGLGGQVGRDEDGDVGIAGGGVEGEGELGQTAEVGQAGGDEVRDGLAEGEALAVVVARAIGDEVVEVELGVRDEADFVVFVDEVAVGAVLVVSGKCEV